MHFFSSHVKYIIKFNAGGMPWKMSVASAESRTKLPGPRSLSMSPIASIREVDDLSSLRRSQMVSVVIVADLVS